MQKATVTAVLIVGTCFASTPAPFARQSAIVDLFFAAALEPATRDAGVSSLERIAEGQPENVDPTLAAVAHLTLEQSELRWLRFPEVRAHALYKIAETGLIESVQFLGHLKAGDLGPDTTGQIDAAIGLSYRQALYRQEKDARRRVELLEAALDERSLPAANGAIAAWAWETLCEQGQIASMANIEKSIRLHYSGQYGEDRIRLCEGKMQTIRSDPDRVKALGTALRLTSAVQDRELIDWAIGQLEALRSEAADRALESYAGAILKLPNNSAERMNLDTILTRIRNRPETPVVAPAVSQEPH